MFSAKFRADQFEISVWFEKFTIPSFPFIKVLFSSWFCMINYYNTVIMKFQISVFYSIWCLNSKTYSVELMEGWMYKIFWWWYFQIWVAWFKNISLWRDFNLKKESSLRSRRLSFFFDTYVHTFFFEFSISNHSVCTYVKCSLV